MRENKFEPNCRYLVSEAMVIRRAPIFEILVKEVSPAGYIKVQFLKTGAMCWKSAEFFNIVDRLPDAKKAQPVVPEPTIVPKYTVNNVPAVATFEGDVRKETLFEIVTTDRARTLGYAVSDEDADHIVNALHLYDAVCDV
jgi:hypothetical protein